MISVIAPICILTTMYAAVRLRAMHMRSILQRQRSFVYAHLLLYSTTYAIVIAAE